MDIKLKEVTTNKDLKDFINFQYSLYKTNKFWVPPIKADEEASLRKDKNPAFDFCKAKYWLAYNGNEIVGRIAGIIHDKYNQKFNVKSARFGWIDFIDDEEVSSLLLKTVESWAKEAGMESIHGPLGFTDMDPEGTLIEGFEEPSTLGAIYNYPYYSKHIEKAGYTKDADWLEFEITLANEVPEKVSRIAEIALKRNNLTLLKVKKSKELLPYARGIFYLINEAYKDLYGFVELSDKQIDLYIKQYFGFISPELVPIVLDSENKIAAFGITMPSLTEAFRKANGSLFPLGWIHILKALKKPKCADLYLTAVRPDLQKKGVNAILINESARAFINRGVFKIETNRELETNKNVQEQWRYFEHRQHKRRRCYLKHF